MPKIQKMVRTGHCNSGPSFFSTSSTNVTLFLHNIDEEVTYPPTASLHTYESYQFLRLANYEYMTRKVQDVQRQWMPEVDNSPSILFHAIENIIAQASKEVSKIGVRRG
jgi:hypothetical protein